MMFVWVLVLMSRLSVVSVLLGLGVSLCAVLGRFSTGATVFVVVMLERVWHHVVSTT